MNYIKQLQKQVQELEIAKDRYNVGLQELAGYLTSEKFHTDTTVQVQDVLNRLAVLRHEAEKDLS